MLLKNVKQDDIVKLYYGEQVYQVPVIRETISNLECDITNLPEDLEVRDNGAVNTIVFSRANGYQKGAFVRKYFDAPRIEELNN